MRWFLTSAIVLSMAAEAHANGRFPEAQLMVTGRGPSASTLAVRATFGVLLSENSGATFRYLCEDVVLGTATVTYDPPIALDRDGRLLVTIWDGAFHVNPDHCGATRIPSLEKLHFSDLDVDASGNVVVAVDQTGFFDGKSAIFRSTDGGATFARLAELPLMAFVTVEIARTNPLRLWLTAKGRDKSTAVYRSDDGGKTVVEVTKLPRADDPYVAGIDPTNADRVWIRLAYIDATFVTRSALYRTDDAGKTWVLAADVPNLMLGFAVDATGKRVWLGGAGAGLQRSFDGAPFVKLPDAPIRCLRHHEGKLWACLGSSTDTFGLSVSCDDGATLAPALDLHSVDGTFSCPSGSAEAKCEP